MTTKPLTDKIPYYAVIFTSTRNDKDEKGYQQMAGMMENLVRGQPGFLGFDSARDTFGTGITVSYWESLESINSWKENTRHREAQKLGKQKWYEQYSIKICKVEKEYPI